MKTILYIGNKLSKHGYSLTSIETLGVLLSKEGYTMFYSSSILNKIGRLLDMVFTTIKLRNKVDFVLIDTYSTSNFWYAFLVSSFSRIFKIRYVPILRGGNLPNRLANNPKLSQMIFANAHINVAPSNYLYSVFKERGYTNIIHIPNSIELEKYRFIHKKYTVPKLLWVRSLDDIYNPEMAIKVLAKVKEKYQEATLTMIGGEKNRTIESLQQVARANNVLVEFTGKLSKTEWVARSKNHNIFINTTHVDNTPVSVMEAAALGFPIVSTNVGGIPFLLQNNENALLVNDDAVDEMVSAIIQIIENNEIRTKLITNSLKLSKTFDWQVVKNDWFKILN